MKKITYGIMSTASIVERFVQAVRASKNGEVVAIASRSLEKAKNKAADLKIPKSFGSYEELVSCEEVQVVYIPTINHMHFENAKLALNHGKHVLLEKPMTLSEEHTAYLFKLAKKKNLFIMEAQKSVFLPITIEVKEKIKEGIIGKVHYARYTMSYPEVEFDWFYDVNKGGGALYGNAGYILSHSSYILDQELVAPSGQATFGNSGIDLACILNAKTPEGVLIQGHVTTLLDMVSQAEIYGDRGKITIKDFWKAREAVIEISGEQTQKLSHPVDYEMVYEVDHVNACIENGLIVSPVMSDKRSIDIARKIDSYHRDFKG